MAFVRIGQFDVKPDKIDELRNVYAQEAIPAIRAASGNVSAVLLQQNDAQASFLAITIWQTQADAESYDKSGMAQAMVNKVRHTFAGPPKLVTYSAYGLPARAP